jgi:hypothetical protein
MEGYLVKNVVLLPTYVIYPGNCVSRAKCAVKSSCECAMVDLIRQVD